MRVPDLPDLPEFQAAKRSLSRDLVDLAWDGGTLPQTFQIEHEGATGEVEVRIKRTNDAPFAKNFIENLSE
jgi:hypothetical protein